MNIPLQATRITDFRCLLPARRNVLFFDPVLDAGGHLIDLQERMPFLPMTEQVLAGSMLSARIASETAALPANLCEQLQNGIVCQLTYEGNAGEEGQLLITPVPNGYLVEVLADANEGYYTPARLPAPIPKTQQDEATSTLPESFHTHNLPLLPGVQSELLEIIIASTPVGLALLRPVREASQLVGFSHVWTNPAYTDLHEKTTDLRVGQSSTAALFDRLAEVVQKGTTLHYTKEVHQGGSVLYREFILVRVGEYVLCTVTDISALMNTKALLHEKNSQLEQLITEQTRQVRDLSTLQNAILKYAGLAIVSTNEAGIIQTANQATELLLGYAGHELIGQTVRLRSIPVEGQPPVVVVGSPDALAGNVSFFQSLWVDGGFIQQECLLVNKRGQLVPVLIMASRLDNEQGAPIGYITIATDISAIKRAESELVQKNKLLDTFFAGALDMHCITDRKGFLLEVNHAFQTAMGYSAAELRTIQLMRLIHPDERVVVSRQVLNGVQRQPVRNQINRWRRKDGSYRIIEWSAIGVDGLVYGSARDITDRQAAEDQLRWLHERLQLATAAAGQGIWENDLVSGKVSWDERLWEIHGLPLPVHDLTFSDYLALIHPEDLPALMEKFRHELQGENDTLANVYRIVKPDGDVRYLETNGRIIRDAEGRTLRIIGVAWDVTLRSLAEESLRASEHRYRSLVNHLDIIVFQTNEFGVWTYLNPAWELITGFTVEESLGGFFLDSIWPGDQDESRQLFNEIKAGQRTSVRHVIRYNHRNGGYRWIDVHAQVILNERKVRLGVTGTLTDITDQKIAEVAILESEQRFREIAENVDEIFWISNEENQFVYANPAFERFSGIAPALLYRDPVVFLSCIFEEDRSHVCEVFFSITPGATLTFRAYRQDGVLRWLQARMFSITNDEGNFIRRIGVVSDITTAIEKEQILETSLNNERALNNLKSQFITTASHEFRTPLMAISSSTELVRYYLDEDRIPTSMPLIHKHLDAVLAKVSALNELIGDTLTLGKIEQGKIVVKLEWIDLVSLCKALILSTFADRSDHRHVNVVVKGPVLPVLIDQKLMTHVLTNLLTNAFKFSTKNVEISLAYTPAEVIIAVSDRGIGIPKKDLPHLFGKFFRATNAINYPGSGLGLAICQEYTNQMNGRLEVTSREGVGTTFFIIIPQNDQPY